MRFLLTSFLTELALQLRRKRTWFLMLLLPAVMLAAVKLIPAEEAAAPVRVGVVIPEGDEAGKEYMERLSLRSGAVVTFVPADEATARRNVAAANWDCAILLPDDFAQRVEELDTRRLLTLITGPASVVYPVVRETAAACLAEQIAPLMAGKYLLDAGMTAEGRLSELWEELEEVLPSEQRVQLELQNLGGKTLEVQTLGNQGLSETLSGAAAILLLVWAMFSAIDLGVWLETPFARRLCAVKPATAVLLPRAAAALCPALLSGTAALCCLDRPIQRGLALVPFLLLLGALALLCARRRAVWDAFPVLMPFAPFLCLLLSPVIFDVSSLFPALAPLSGCMPVTLYLRTAEGSVGAALAQTGAAALLLLTMLLADTFLKRKLLSGRGQSGASGSPDTAKPAGAAAAQEEAMKSS